MINTDSTFTVVGLCSGAGGLDLGFELAGFQHLHAMDNNPLAVKTLKYNRPSWSVSLADLQEFSLDTDRTPDILLAGVPCQGFSLGGNRQDSDPRNQLYKHVIRIAAESHPRVVVIENVLNLRTMKSPHTGKPFAVQISQDLEQCGYTVFHNIFKMCHYGVPQTRRRFVFVAFRDRPPNGYNLPQPSQVMTPIRPFLWDLAHAESPPSFPNHQPIWGFKSMVHSETHEPFPETEMVYPVRFSRTASDGYPIRSYDQPFPAIDTATVWGWAQGNVEAKRHHKNRKTGKHIRNPKADVTLWRIKASRLRSFTHREYARLQTFPDHWEFIGGNKRNIHQQIGNAVPVEFARQLAKNICDALVCMDTNQAFLTPLQQLTLF
ncbi:MAG: DNA cytosine methyltransferase [Leptolyngbyaceae cyanobacterium]